ncbi:siroheme synthase family protein [Arthrobacter pigmenti]
MTYPISLQLAGRKVLVAGAGPVAARRIPALLDDGADVTVVAPFACEDITEWADAGALRWEQRDYEPADLADAWLVFSYTGSDLVDEQIVAEAEAARIWASRGGSRHTSRMWVPAVAERDSVKVAVNAGGDPKRAAAVRDGVTAALDSGQLPLRRHRTTSGNGSDGGGIGHDDGNGPDGGIGRVALVGGGPADEGLITATGHRLLSQADVVVADRLGPRSILDRLGDSVKIIDVGKSPGHHPVPQESINRILVEEALMGRNVVRLKGGDPYVLGRGGEEVQYCRSHGIDVEVVPGVTSAISVPAAAGIPVTHRGVAKGFSVLTGHEDLRVQAGQVPPGADHTLLLLMGVGRLAESARILIEYGRSPQTPVAIIENGWMPQQRVTTGALADIAATAAERNVASPAVIVVGDVVTLSPHYAIPQSQAGGDAPRRPTASPSYATAKGTTCQSAAAAH